MKTIRSLGGPLIGLDPKLLSLWGGIDSRSFIGPGSSFPNDYEATGPIVDGRDCPPVSMGQLIGPVGCALLIAMPAETAILAHGSEEIYVVQVHYANKDWSLEDIGLDELAKIDYDKGEHVVFVTEGDLVIFDAAYPGHDIGDEILQGTLAKGHYRVSARLYKPNDATLLTVCRFVRIEPKRR